MLYDPNNRKIPLVLKNVYKNPYLYLISGTKSSRARERAYACVCVRVRARETRNFILKN